MRTMSKPMILAALDPCFECGRKECLKDCVSKEGYENLEQIFKDYDDLEEKLTSKKPTNIEYEDECVKYWNCPTCGYQHIAYNYYKEHHLSSYCNECGQKIDWNKGEYR